jgi:hypothetical protein
MFSGELEFRRLIESVDKIFKINNDNEKEGFKNKIRIN